MGLVSRAVFKTVERLHELLVCSIRTAFRHSYAKLVWCPTAGSLRTCWR